MKSKEEAIKNCLLQYQDPVIKLGVRDGFVAGCEFTEDRAIEYFKEILLDFVERPQDAEYYIKQFKLKMK